MNINEDINEYITSRIEDEMPELFKQLLEDFNKEDDE
tara:strand:+ start:278 stop:388 length:111 start_codon:yes stop_codon:yes gene_type:complete